VPLKSQQKFFGNLHVSRQCLDSGDATVSDCCIILHEFTVVLWLFVKQVICVELGEAVS